MLLCVCIQSCDINLCSNALGVWLKLSRSQSILYRSILKHKQGDYLIITATKVSFSFNVWLIKKLTVTASLHIFKTSPHVHIQMILVCANHSCVCLCVCCVINVICFCLFIACSGAPVAPSMISGEIKLNWKFSGNQLCVQHL